MTIMTNVPFHSPCQIIISLHNLNFGTISNLTRLQYATNKLMVRSNNILSRLETMESTTYQYYLSHFTIYQFYSLNFDAIANHTRLQSATKKIMR